MRLLEQMKTVLTKNKSDTKNDSRIRVKAIKNIPNLRMVQGDTYRIDRGSAAQLKVLGWVELIDGIPGLEKAETQHKDMNEARRAFGEVLATNQEAVDADFMGHIPDAEGGSK
jgi:hypothetical protein